MQTWLHRPNVAAVVFVFLRKWHSMNISSLWQQYLAGGGLAGDATAFGVWLIRHSAPPAGVGAKGAVVPDDTAMAGMLIGRLERFLHVATKPLLKAAGLQNPDDFPLLAILFFGGQLPKGHLLKQALIEPATGSEMLKRMKAVGWLIETPHPEDGRSGLMALSPTGRQLVLECFSHLGRVEPILDALTATEKQTLLQLLDKLDAHHSQRHGITQVAAWVGEGW